MANITPEDSERRRRQVTITPDEVAATALPAPDINKLSTFIRQGPRKYKTVEELNEGILDYFKSCMAETYDADGEFNGMVWVRKPTLGSLAVHLGIHRDTLHEWSRSGIFSDSLKSARGVIAAFTEDMLISGKNPVGAINTLLNLRVDWIQDQKNIKVEPVLPDAGAKTVEEIEALVLPEPEG